MNFSVSSLLAGLFFSTIGIWLLKEAKKRSNLKLIPIAVSLLLYTFFTNSATTDWLIGLTLCGFAYHFWI